MQIIPISFVSFGKHFYLLQESVSWKILLFVSKRSKLPFSSSSSYIVDLGVHDSHLVRVAFIDNETIS